MTIDAATLLSIPVKMVQTTQEVALIIIIVTTQTTATVLNTANGILPVVRSFPSTGKLTLLRVLRIGKMFPVSDNQIKTKNVLDPRES